MIADLDEELAQRDRGSSSTGTTAVFGGDLTKEGVCESLVGSTVDAFGKLDIVVNNAGYTWDGIAHRMGDDQFRAMLEIHTVVPFRILQGGRAALPRARPSRRRPRDARSSARS